jgi:hypothetical protein
VELNMSSARTLVVSMSVMASAVGPQVLAQARASHENPSAPELNVNGDGAFGRYPEPGSNGRPARRCEHARTDGERLESSQHGFRCSPNWRSARAAESARLESVCGETHRGFESHLLRAVR